MESSKLIWNIMLVISIFNWIMLYVMFNILILFFFSTELSGLSAFLVMATFIGSAVFTNKLSLKLFEKKEYTKGTLLSALPLIINIIIFSGKFLI